ncbi:MAG: YraN family protein [Clostridia bacterium]|nr:YraN family protein [Clostridia bacterium]
MNIKRIKGDAGESYTAKWLRKHRYKVTDTNYSCRFGEIDIIARKGDFICFVEVKTRSSTAIDRPASAVGIPKQRRIITTAQHYLASFPCELQPRFDVAEVITDGDRIKEFNYIENAFGEII